MASGVHWFDSSEAEFSKWGDLVSYYSFKLEDPINNPSPRYWLLWPGVLVMIASSFAELGVQYKLIWFALKSAWKGMAMAMNSTVNKLGKKSNFLEKQSHIKAEHIIADPAREEDQVQMWQWGPALILVIVATCVVLGLQYHLDPGMSLLAVLLGFIFAFLAIQCTGVTDTTPLTTAAKATQLILGGATSGAGYPAQEAQLMNLIGGAIASGAAGQSTDLVVDFRVGFLLSTPPKLQWYAQAIGSIVAMFMSPGMFILFMKAYPCVLNMDEKCSFSAPSAAAWKAVAIAVTEPTIPVPKSSAIFSLCLAIVSVLAVLIRHNFLNGHREKYRLYIPNFMAIGLAFVLPATQYSTAMLAGAIVAYVWAKRNAVSFDLLCYAIAAGMIAGEGLGGVVNAVLEISGVGPAIYGSAVGCPGDSFCG